MVAKQRGHKPVPIPGRRSNAELQAEIDAPIRVSGKEVKLRIPKRSGRVSNVELQREIDATAAFLAKQAKPQKKSKT